LNEIGAECLVLLRRGAALLCALIVAVLLILVGVLGRLAYGPMDVTALTTRVMPVTIARGVSLRHPAGRLIWRHVLIAWRRPGLGLDSGFELSAEDARILRRDGSAAVSVGHFAAVVPVRSLLHRHVAPTALLASDGDVALRRAVDGTVDLDLPGARSSKAAQVPISLSDLRIVRVSRTRLDFHDPVPSRDGGDHVLRLREIETDLRREEGRDRSWRGDAGVTVLGEGARTRLSAVGVPLGMGMVWTLGVTPVRPEIFAPLSPVLARFHLPVSGRAVLRFVPVRPGAGSDAGRMAVLPSGLGLKTADVRGWVGRGTVDQPGGPALSLHGGQVDLGISAPDPGRLRGVSVDLRTAGVALADEARPDRPEMVFHAGGRGWVSDLLHPVVMDADVHADGSDFDFSDLGAVWPQAIMRGAQRWVTRNITEGQGHGLRVVAHLHSDRGVDALLPTRMEGGLSAEGVTVQWLAPVAAARNISARLSFVAADALEIAFSHGEQPTATGMLRIPSGTMRIGDLYAKDQDGLIQLAGEGALPDFVSLLSEPRLHLLSRHPFPFDDVQGQVRGHLRLHLPLKAHLDVADLGVNVHADFDAVHLGHVVLGRAVDGAHGGMDATVEGMTLVGAGALGGIPTDVTVKEDFRAGAADHVVEDVRAVSHLTPENVVRARVAPDGLFGGTAEVASTYQGRADGRADIGLELDLAGASLRIPVWEKAAGVGASAGAHIRLQDHGFVALDGMRATGPDLDLQGRAVIGDGKVRRLVLDAFHVGRSRGNAVIDVPQVAHGAIGVNVQASTLDLAPLVHPDASAPKRERVGSRYAGQAWAIDVRAHRVLYSKAGALGDVAAHLENDGRQLSVAHVTMASPTVVRASIVPLSGGRHVDVEIADLGALLTAFGMTDRVAGGRTTLSGRLAETPASGGVPPFDGVVDIGPFAFERPPTALTAASRLSVYDWSKSNAQRFEVTQMHLPVRYADSVVRIRDGHLGNDALGATVQGDVGLPEGRLGLTGTIVPVFAINALPGRLPGVGKLFSPEKGGGFLATTFSLGGTAGAPEIRVHPLSMLLPGVLRKLAE